MSNCGIPWWFRFDPWIGKILGEGNGNPLQYSCLENPTDKGAWSATVHGVAKSQIRLRLLFLSVDGYLGCFRVLANVNSAACNAGDLGSILGGGHGNPLQYSCLENPHWQRTGGLQSMVSQRVRHDWAAKHSTVCIWPSQVTLVRNPPAAARDVSLIPESERSHGEGNSNPH